MQRESEVSPHTAIRRRASGIPAADILSEKGGTTVKSKKFILLVLIPVFLHVIIFMVIPIIGSGVISFMDYNPLQANNQFIGLDNYRTLLAQRDFKKAMVNTFVFVGAAVALNLVISLTLSAIITQFRSNRTRSFFRMMVFLPCIAPLVASSVVWHRSIFPTADGLINLIITSLGGTGLNWLGSADYLMISVILFTLWADVGYNVILFSAGMDSIPSEFYEAAAIDGSGRWNQFWRVTLPLLGRTFSFVLIMTIISYFQMFAQFNVLALKNGPQNSGLVMTSYIYKLAFTNKRMGLGSAASAVLFLIIMVVTLIQQRLSKVDWEY